MFLISKVRKMSVLLSYFTAMACMLVAGVLDAAELSGRVTDQSGQPLSGVMVTASMENGSLTVTRYTSSDGRYVLGDLPEAKVHIRTRLVGFSDQLRNDVDTSTATRLDFQMQTASRDELLASLPANVWTERVKIDDPVHNQRFRIHCMGCHQQGAPMTRWPQTQEQWSSVFDRMAHKSALITPESRRVIADALIKAYALEENEIPRIPEAPGGAALDAEVMEWRFVSSSSWLHDAKVGPDGIVYATDSTLGRLLTLDPGTHETGVHEFEDFDPEHKNFIGTSTKTYPHGLGIGPDGNVWVLLGLDQSVAKFDVKKKEVVARYKLPFGAIFPHTARFDDKGRLWFSLALSNQLGMFNPETEDFTIVDLPTRTTGQWLVAKTAPLVLWVITKFRFETSPDPEAMPLPYGVDVAPDGKVWVSQWNNAAIVSYDPETEALESFDTPFYGPRRLAVDSRGDVWVPAWGEGRIYRFTPSTGEYKGYDLPVGPGGAAYTVDVHPRDDSVWVCGANSDTMMRFDSTAETFIVYPMPSSVTFCRDVAFDNEGNVWSNYSNFPTQQIGGGGVPGIVRIRTNLN